MFRGARGGGAVSPRGRKRGAGRRTCLLRLGVKNPPAWPPTFELNHIRGRLNWGNVDFIFQKEWVRGVRCLQILGSRFPKTRP